MSTREKDKKSSKSREGHRSHNGDDRHGDAPRPPAAPRDESRTREDGHKERRHRDEKERQAAEGERRPGSSAPKEHREREHREHKEHREHREHKDREAARESGRERRSDREQREHRDREHRDREHRDRDRDREVRGDKKEKKSADPEAWLDGLIDDCKDGSKPARDAGGGANGESVPGRDKMPKRPSSRADSRPKGDHDSSSRKKEAQSNQQSEHGSKQLNGADPRTGQSESRPAKAAEAAAPVRPQAPAAAPVSPAPRRHVPMPEMTDDDDEIPEEPIGDEDPVPPPKKSATRSKADADIDEDIPDNVGLKSSHKTLAKEAAKDEIDEEIEYDDDFEEVEEDDAEEEYKPRVAASARPPPEADKPSNRLVSIRPQSAARRQPAAQAAGTGAAAPQPAAPPAAVDIKKAMESENERLKKVQSPPASSTNATKGTKIEKGFMADYESTMPKFSLSGASAAETRARQRLKDLDKMGVLKRRSAEKVDLYQQRPQKDIALFLAGKSLKYCNLKTVSSQTGDDDMEVGVMTDDVWTDDQEMQFPTLNMGNTGKPGSEVGQLLPFLRRVLPLFEAAIAERREDVNGLQAQIDPSSSSGASGGSRGGAARSQAQFSLNGGFVQGCIGSTVSVVDMSVCPQWYGADHAVVLYTWPEAARSSAGSTDLEKFTRPLRSIVGVYPIPLASADASVGTTKPQPARCLHAYCRLCSVTVVQGRAHLIIAGTEMGSLLVWDLRNKPHSPAVLLRSEGRPAARAPPNAENGLNGHSTDPEVAHFEGNVWVNVAFSTDEFALKESDDPLEDDGKDSMQIGGGVHCVEICCVRCSDVVGADSLIFAMDLMGIVSFWRVLELASISQQSLKLALQGSIALADGAHVLGDFLSAPYLCIHPQQQVSFAVISTAGLRQAHRKRSTAIGDGPSTLELMSHADELKGEEEVATDSLQLRHLSQPRSAAFNPFFPGLLLVAFTEGDLALFDTSICVPITHWGGAVAGARAAHVVSVAWSPRRPCVFFVKCGASLDVWDLAEQTISPVLSIDLAASAESAGVAAAVACSELYVSPCGRPVVGHCGGASVFGLPLGLTVPLQVAPAGHKRRCKPVDELLKEGYERTSVFPTLLRHRREVDVPKHYALERDLFAEIVAAMQPLQAWI